MTKETQERVKENFLASTDCEYIAKCIKKYRNVDERIEAIEKAGYIVSNNVPMGSGGVGQIRVMRNLNEIRVQVSCGIGKNNYAKAVVFDLTKHNFYLSATELLIMNFGS